MASLAHHKHYYKPFQPWSVQHSFFDEVNRLFERGSANDAAAADWAPGVDIDEHADKFVLTVDVPGIDPSSIEITLEKGVLTLAGSRAASPKQEGVERRRTERVAGRFQRRFTLPDTADSDAVSATGKHGVLEVVIPKRAQVQPRRIAVSV